jgi:hypothetical protein
VSERGVRLGAALGLVAREPVALMTLIFAMRVLAAYPLGLLFLWVVPLGYLTRVLRGSLQDDAVPLPGARALPATAGLGCATWLGLLLAALVGAMMTMAIAMLARATLPETIAQTITVPVFEALKGAGRTNWVNWLLWPMMLWLLSGMWVAVASQSKDLTWEQVNQDGTLVGSIVGTWSAVFFRPPLNRDGLVLAPLLTLLVWTGPWLFSASHLKLSGLLAVLPVLCGVLYAHCLGQYVRRRLVGTNNS